jgi:hypothetical protein
VSGIAIEVKNGGTLQRWKTARAMNNNTSVVTGNSMRLTLPTPTRIPRTPEADFHHTSAFEQPTDRKAGNHCGELTPAGRRVQR